MLKKIKIPVTLGFGIDTKKDEKQLQGSLLSLQNGYIKKTGAMSKRNGYDKLARDIFNSSSTISEASSLPKYDNELLLLNSEKLYSYVVSSDKWADKGASVTSSTQITPVISNSYSQRNPDMAISSGIAVYVWEDSSGGVRASVSDMASGSSYAANELLHATAIQPKVVVCNNMIFIFYSVTATTSLKCRRVVGGVISGEVTVASDMAQLPYAVTTLSTRMVVGYSEATGLKLLYWHDSMIVGGLISGSPEPISTMLDASISIDMATSSTSNDILHVAMSSSSATRYTSYNPDFTERVAPVTLAALQTINLGIVAFEETADLFYEKSNIIYYSQVVSGTASASVAIQRAGGLISKPFYYGNSVYIIVAFQSVDGFQDTYFCIDETGKIAARLHSTVAGGLSPVNSCLSAVSEYEGRFYTTLLKKSRIADVSVITSVTRLEISFSNVHTVTSQLGKNLHFSGGYVKMYDGFSLTEHNFHLYPDRPVSSPLTGGVLVAGSYQYIIIFEWIDHAGAVHRSETSVAITVVTTSGNNGVRLAIPTLRYTDKKGTRTPPIISIFRTIKDGTIFYKLSSDSSPLYNSHTVDTVTFDDKTVTDAVLQTRQLLYTTGGVVDNAPAPSCTYMRTYKNRLFAVGLENPTELAYSKEFVEGEGIAFSTLFRKQVDSKGGKLYTLAELDDKLLLFKESNIFTLTGNGPTDSGTQDDFYIQALTADIDCSEPASLVETPLGVMFKSKKGIWLLDRGLNTKYIGDRVEEFNSFNITSATLVADLNQVRFTASEGTTLVYDYFYDTWSTFTNQVAIAATNWDSSFVFSNADGEVFVENMSYADAGAPIKLRIETGWFALSGLQGFGRLYLIQLLGTYKSAHVLKVSVSYDYNEAIKDMYSVSITDRQIFGDPDLIGEVFGGAEDENYQFEIKPRIQKCEAFKLIIEDVSPDSTPQEALELSAITISYGQKSGASKLPGTRRM